MKKYPLISIVIPTYNSQATLKKVLEAIRQQTYPQNKIEILVIDGGSIDKTVDIAKRYTKKILLNPDTLQVYAKHIGYVKAKGKYIVHLDSDEVLVNRNSIKKKYEFFLKNEKVGAVVVSGLKTPSGLSKVNDIINEYGDPFSHFLYHNSTTDKFFIDALAKYGKIILKEKDGIILDFSETKLLPLLELSAIGIMIDRDFIRKNLPSLWKNTYEVSHVFYRLVKKKKYLACVYNDPVLHYSAPDLQKYLRKIKSRVLNNIFSTQMGMSAFSGREVFYPSWFKLKKYLFVAYTLSIILPLLDGIYLALTRKSIIFLIHPLLCIYVLALVVYFYFLKIARINIQMRAWGS